MALSWSFSSERTFRRCQRAFFFKDIAAHYSGQDPLRREAFILKQLKSLDLWRGTIVHTAIQNHVVPCLQNRRPIDWGQIIEQAKALARKQYSFSKHRRFREEGLSKSSVGDIYCALSFHDQPDGTTDDQVRAAIAGVETAVRNLSQMDDLLKEIQGRQKYFCELSVPVKYHDVNIRGQIDLMYFRGYNQPTVIDWKCYDSTSGSDANLQTALYAWLLCKHPKWTVTDPSSIELIEVRLGRDPGVVKHTFDTARFEELEDRIFQSVEEIRALCNDGSYAEENLADYAFAANPNSCAYCPFRKLCQEARPCLITQ
jgi:CRISPR/Cas system-associated exonuclease Cas4 (RecB family)